MTCLKTISHWLVIIVHEIAFLPTITETKDELLQPVRTTIYDRRIFVEKSSQPRQEFFQLESTRGGQVGLRRSCVLIVNTFEYDDEETVKFRDKVYTVYRTFDRKDEKTELYCEERAGRG